MRDLIRQSECTKVFSGQKHPRENFSPFELTEADDRVPLQITESHNCVKQSNIGVGAGSYEI